MENFDLKKFGERFSGLRSETMLNQKQFGDKFGIHQSTVSDLEKGNRLPTTDQLIAISRYFNKSTDWLLYGTESDQLAPKIAEPQSEYSATVTIPVYALAGAGSPCCIDSLEPIRTICVEKKMDGPNIRVIQVRGDSMQPTLFDGCHCGVDVTDKHIVSGELYAVYIPYEGIVVKRIAFGHGTVKIISDNPLVPSDEIFNDRINWDSFIQGRVKWWIVVK